MQFDDAFQGHIQPFSGGWRQCATSVKRSVSQLTSGARQTYIGVASDGDYGCQEHWNNMLKGRGYQAIATIYHTESENFREQMKQEMLDFYGTQADCDGLLDNKIGDAWTGGIGDPPYTLYVAWC